VILLGRRKKRGIFYEPPYHEKYAKIVTFESRAKAREAARQLVEEAQEAKRPSKVRRILRVLNLAAVRARAGAKNPKFDTKTKKKWRDIAKIYESAKNRVSRILARKK